MVPDLDPKRKVRLWLVKLFDVVCRLPRWTLFHRVLTSHAASTPDFFFVQIGANDGIIYDHIHQYVDRYHWNGILVEPVSHYFTRLENNYRGNPNLVFENVAISDRDEIRDFYRVREGLEYLPKWCDGLGTFYLDVLLTHRWAIPDIRKYVVTEQVPCLSFESLLKKHAVAKIDLLSIDTEGYDYEIIKQIDFERMKPSLILYEHQYIDKTDRRHCETMLEARDYSLTRHLGNTLAFLAPPTVRPA